ncbi:MAG: NADPH-dependent oxidoreductase [Beijerinckiaceae bacterium]
MSSQNSALALRYGTDNAPTTGSVNELAANSVINLMLAHRSVRSFKPDALPEGTLEILVAAAQSAATSSNLQAWSVVALEDQEAKAQCAVLAGGQKHIADCPLFLLFIADLARLNQVAESVEIAHDGNDTFEMFLVAAIDASLAAQNATLAAESLGLGTVYIGGMRDKPEAVAALLGLPPATAVVFGLCVGYVVEGKGGSVKPRLPQEAVLHRERYDSPRQDEAITRYNAAMVDFYVRESMNVRGDWSRHSAKRIAGEASLSGRHLLMKTLRRMGFFKSE